MAVLSFAAYYEAGMRLQKLVYLHNHAMQQHAEFDAANEKQTGGRFLLDK